MNFAEQKSRILSGKMYNDLTPELIEARQNAVRLVKQYHDSFGHPEEERIKILQKL